ncbi:hypothetical protein Cci01nite_47340 [Catellatospora citrea]|uniref:DUF4244 domain-containing protein n=1 Tax=Catellatospora citrea TaxID=53366 RepID=A0A8J3P0P0_9ACTN|nr:uncharacterized protein DUF4244 [Catellatospora citrea]GIF99640.1 hypothetical protein Cci01nite_47340 [Catellatospora citrea]
MPRQRSLRAEGPLAAAAARTAIRPLVPAPALLRDVDADAAAILAEAVDPVDAEPSRRAETASAVRPAGPPDAGMNTAEYAVGTLAAVAFAGLLLKVLTSDSVQAALAGVIQRALG